MNLFDMMDILKDENVKVKEQALQGFDLLDNFNENVEATLQKWLKEEKYDLINQSVENLHHYIEDLCQKGVLFDKDDVFNFYKIIKYARQDALVNLYSHMMVYDKKNKALKFYQTIKEVFQQVQEDKEKNQEEYQFVMNTSNLFDLFKKAGTGELEAIKELVRQKADLNVNDGELLRLNLDFQKMDAAKLLVDSGADLFIKNWYILSKALFVKNMPVIDFFMNYVKENKVEVDAVEFFSRFEANLVTVPLVKDLIERMGEISNAQLENFFKGASENGHLEALAYLARQMIDRELVLPENHKNKTWLEKQMMMDLI